jgi:hypothetical protein
VRTSSLLSICSYSSVTHTVIRAQSACYRLLIQRVDQYGRIFCAWHNTERSLCNGTQCWHFAFSAKCFIPPAHHLVPSSHVGLFVFEITVCLSPVLAVKLHVSDTLQVLQVLSAHVFTSRCLLLSSCAC